MTSDELDEFVTENPEPFVRAAFDFCFHAPPKFEMIKRNGKKRRDGIVRQLQGNTIFASVNNIPRPILQHSWTKSGGVIIRSVSVARVLANAGWPAVIGYNYGTTAVSPPTAAVCAKCPHLMECKGL